jgi:hypothetical protein
MKKVLALTFVTFAIAAGMAITESVQVAQAKNNGVPFGQVVSNEAQAGKADPNDGNENGYGDDIRDLCDGGQCTASGVSHRGLGDFRASDEADKSPGKGGNQGPTKDEVGRNPDN